MLHKTLEVKTTITELGEFSAIAAAYSTDRGNERIVPGAFEGTIEKWQASGKQLPLHWDHQGSPDSIVGVVDPMSMKETDAGLMVSGKLDLENSDVAKEAWRAMKSNSLGLSFGYMVIDGEEAKDGVYELKAVDLFEISITPAPMNPDTRFLALKSVTQMTPEEMRAEIAALKARLGEMTEALPPSKNVTATDRAVEDASDEEPAKAKSQAQDPLKQASRDAMLDVLSGGASSQKYVQPEKPEPVEPLNEADQHRRFVELHIH